MLRFVRAVMVLALSVALTRAATADPLLGLLGAQLLREAGLLERGDALARDGIIRQRAELTCGPAALASLLTFYFEDPAGEDEMAKLSGTYEQLGTSMLGLRNACRAKGYAAAGYRMSLAELAKTLRQTELPVLVHYREPLQHFVLVVAMEGDYVLVSDPASGSVTVETQDFVRRWSGAVLVVQPRGPADRERVRRRRALVTARVQTLRRTNRAMGLPRL